MKALSGRVAIVTGATRGVGRGVALELAAAGAHVYATGRTLREGDSELPGSLESTAEAAAALAGDLTPVVCDHRDDATVRELFERVRRDSGRLDVLVNNAFLLPEGIEPNVPFWETPLHCWDDMLAVGTRSAYTASHYAAPLMLERGSGLIANVSSAGAVEFHLHVAYGVGKAALDRITRDTALQLRPHGVAVVSIWPYFVRTERMLQLDTEDWNLDLAHSESQGFTGRAVVALAADEDVIERSGGAYTSRQLAQAYAYRDEDGMLPDEAATAAAPGSGGRESARGQPDE